MELLTTKRRFLYLYLGLAIVSLLLAGASYARAEDPVDTGRTPGDMRADASANRTALKEETQNRLINLVRNAYGRMEGAVTRLENITTRIETRATALSEAGVDTNMALIPLESARAELTAARKALEQAKSDAEAGLLSETPRERFIQARSDFRSVRDTIRSAYIHLQEALAELKDAVIEVALNRQGVSSVVQDDQANVSGSTQD